MVCDIGLMVGVIASAVLDGACCLHSLDAEKRRREVQHEAMRRAIGRVESDRRRPRLRSSDDESRERDRESLRREAYWLGEAEARNRHLIMEIQRLAGGGSETTIDDPNEVDEKSEGRDQAAPILNDANCRERMLVGGEIDLMEKEVSLSSCMEWGDSPLSICSSPVHSINEHSDEGYLDPRMKKMPLFINMRSDWFASGTEYRKCASVGPIKSWDSQLSKSRQQSMFDNL